MDQSHGIRELQGQDNKSAKTNEYKVIKAYRTVSNEVLCILTGMTPIEIKIEEAPQIYQHTRGNTKGEEAQVDTHMEVKHWQYLGETIARILEDIDERCPIQIFTDGGKTEKEVRAGIAIFKSGHHIKSPQFRLINRCTNKQAAQLAILTALKYTETLQTRLRQLRCTRTAK